jgi:hypothetical protein
MNLPGAVYVDTNFYLSGLNARDEYHQRAFDWLRALQANRCRFVTTEAVLWEFLNACSPVPVRAKAIESYERLHADPQVEIVGYEPALIAEAVDLYRSRPDKAWGMVDCFSFTVMKRNGLSAALTADHHFEQAGHSALLLHDLSGP